MSEHFWLQIKVIEWAHHQSYFGSEKMTWDIQQYSVGATWAFWTQCVMLTLLYECVYVCVHVRQVNKHSVIIMPLTKIPPVVFVLWLTRQDHFFCTAASGHLVLLALEVSAPLHHVHFSSWTMEIKQNATRGMQSVQRHNVRMNTYAITAIYRSDGKVQISLSLTLSDPANFILFLLLHLEQDYYLSQEKIFTFVLV